MRYYRFTALCAVLMSHALSAQILFPKQQDNLFGYIDTTGSWVIYPQFHQAGFYNGMKAIASRNDSLFLILNKDMILYLPDLKNYSDFGSGRVAIQNKQGKWAVANSSFNPLTPFEYNRIQIIDSLYIVTRNGLSGLVSPRFREVVPCAYQGVQKLPNGQFRLKQKEADNIFEWVADSMRLVMRNVNLIFLPEYPKIYTSYNKKSKSTVIFDMNGDSVYGCTKCHVFKSFGDYVFIKHGGVKMLDLQKKAIRRELNTASDIVIEKRRPGFMYLADSKEVFAPDSHEPIIGDSLGIDSVVYVNREYVYVMKGGNWGIYDYKGQVVLPCMYYRIELTDSLMAEAFTGSYKEVFYLPLRKKIMTVDWYAVLTRDESNILVYSQDKPCKLYSVNDRMDLTDSAEFKSMVMIKAGTRVLSYSSTGVTPLMNTNNFNAGINTSNSDRWFARRAFYGLKGLNGDTLIRPRFISVYKVNDSVDIVVQRTSSRTLRYVAGAGNCNVNTLYGVINNRTGRFIIPPQFYYMDTRVFGERPAGVARVIVRSGNFALVDVETFRVLPGTECSYITDPHEGLMRLLYQARFSVFACETPGKISKVPRNLMAIQSFWPYGFTEFQNRVNNVYVTCGSVNVADSTGRLFFDAETASGISYADEGHGRNFITVSQANRYGVVSAEKGLIIPWKYSCIKRLPHDRRYFILQANNKKYGYVNSSGTELSEAIFEQAQNFGNDYAWCKTGDSMSLIDRKGNIQPTAVKKSQVIAVSEGLTFYRERKGWVLMNIDGEEITEERFKRVMPFSNGAAAASNKSSWGLINTMGDWIIDPQYESFEVQNEQVVIFSNERHYFIHNKQGVLLNKLRKKGVIKTLGEDYLVMERNGLAKAYYNNGEAFKKRKYRQDLRCLHDTLMIVSNLRLEMYAPSGTRIARYQHKGGAKAIDRGMLEIARTKELHLVKLKIPKSMRELHKDVFSDSIEKLTLIKPEGNGGMRLVNLHMQECIKYNAFIYEFEFNKAKFFYLSDSLGNLLNEQFFTRLQYYGNGLFRGTFYNENNTAVAGILNQYGLWVVEPKFYEIKSFHSDIAVYSKQTDFWIADENGKSLSDEVLVDYTFHKGYYCFRTENQSAWWHPEKGWLSPFSK